ncbi:hypothetical protein LguiB_032627 [Lonicera macranthoides]
MPSSSLNTPDIDTSFNLLHNTQSYVILYDINVTPTVVCVFPNSCKHRWESNLTFTTTQT